MTFDETLALVTPQRFKRIDTGHGTSAVIPLCSNPTCNKPLNKFNEAKWCSLEQWPRTPAEEPERFELRAFCRNEACDIFRRAEDLLRSSDPQLWIVSAWWSLGQLWCSDQRGAWELAGKERLRKKATL